VNADYRLAPEHKFPTAINDAYDIAQWALSQASTLGADPSKDFLLSGSSAGGCLATVTALRLRDEKISPPVTGLHLMVPLLCYPPALPEKCKPFDHAITQNAEAPILNTSGMKFFFDHYIPNESDRYTELFSPFLWKSGFKNFPRTYFQIAGMDALRDQELLFERRLREEEHVETRVDVYQGVPHGFYTAFPKLGASARFVRDWVPGFEWLLK
jgi:acetyl esterase/lipase